MKTSGWGFACDQRQEARTELGRVWLHRDPSAYSCVPCSHGPTTVRGFDGAGRSCTKHVHGGHTANFPRCGVREGMSSTPTGARWQAGRVESHSQ